MKPPAQAAQVAGGPGDEGQFFQLLSLLLGDSSEGKVLCLLALGTEPKAKCLQRHVPKTAEVFPYPYW